MAPNTLDHVSVAALRAAGAANWLIAGPSMVAPRRTAETLGSPAPRPPFPTQAWSGMAVMFGFMFQIASDPLRKRAMIRYGWAEKLVSASAITIGFGVLPPTDRRDARPA